MSASALVAWILLATALISSLYAWLLNRIHHLYAPDHIWITVVVGNAFVGGMLALWLWLEPLPAAPLAAFWRLIALNIAAGIPIIGWQIGQANARQLTRRRPPHAEDDPRGPAAAERA